MATASFALPSAARTDARLATRLELLKAAPRKPGEASFFFYDAFFKNDGEDLAGRILRA